MAKRSGDCYRLLLVDDDSAFLTTTKLGLEGSYPNIEVVPIGESGTVGRDDFVSAGTNALEYLERARFGEEPLVHCILIDHNMSGMTGLDLLRRIRDRDEYAPVVMLTGDEVAMHGAAVESFDSGARGYLFKTSHTFWPELNTTIHRVYQEVVREKWLDILSNVAAIDVEALRSRESYANEVLDIVKARFPRRVAFFRERTSDGCLTLLACSNVPASLQDQLQSIDPDDYPFVKETLEFTRSTFDNMTHAWHKAELGKAADLPLDFDRAFCVPLRYATELLGSVSLYMDRSQGFFLQEEQSYADTLAKIVAATFFQYEYRHKLRVQAENVTRVIQDFSKAQDERDVYEILAAHIHKEVNVEKHPHRGKGMTVVKAILPGTDRMPLVGLLGEARKHNLEFRVSDQGNGISGWVAYTGKPRLVRNKNEHEETWV